MALSTEVGLSPGDFVLDGDPAPLPKRGRGPLPNFRPIVIATNGWMHQGATWYGGRPQTRGLCYMGTHPLSKGGGALQIIGPFIIVIVISLEHCTVVIGLFKFKF